MDNPVVQTDLAEVLGEIRQELRTIDNRLNKIEIGQAEIKGQLNTNDEKLSGQIKSLDEKLSGQIKSLDERLSGQIKSLDTKTGQLDKRIGNSELTNRGILIGLIVAILGGAAKFFGIVGNP